MSFEKVQSEKLPSWACETCGGSGDNDPSGENGSSPTCPTCNGTGEKPYTLKDNRTLQEAGVLRRP